MENELDKFPNGGAPPESISYVYHVHFLDQQLPESDAEKIAFAEDYARELTCADLDDITCFIQRHTGDPSFRLTISVPQRLVEAVRRIRESGLEPEFTEPERPYVAGNSCVIPGSFQIRHFGVTLNPRAISDHPQRQSIIAETLAEYVPDFPEVAKDFLNWNYIEADEDTGLAVIYWGEDDGEGDLEIIELGDDF